MIRRLFALAGALAFIVLVVWVQAVPAAAQQPARVAYVVGNAEYGQSPLPTALNDAGLVAEALRTVGFEVIEGANLNQADFFASFRDFLAKAEAAGPDAVLFVYVTGYGFAFDGENYLAAVDAKLDRESDVPLYTMRLSDLIRSLDGMPARSKVVAVDAARRLPFPLATAGLPPGLIAIEAPQNFLIGFSAAPGQIVADTTGSYGPYATAIAEMVRAAGVDIAGAFTRIRARTHQLTEGRQTPWEVAALSDSVVLVPAEASAAAPAPAMPVAAQERRPFREIGPEQAYAVAIERDELPVYGDFVEAYPDHPYAPRVWAIIRARREALAWRRATRINSPESYWTYLQRYPNGIYAADCERRLRRFSAPYQPPPDFVPIEFADVPPPLPGEPVIFVEFVPLAPPPPIILIAPRPTYFVNLPPPPPPVWRGGLPAVTVLPVIPRVAPGVRVPVAARPGFHDSGGGRRPPPQGAIAVPPGPPPGGPQGGGGRPGPGAARPPGGPPAPGTAPTAVRPGAPAVVTAPAAGSPPSQNNGPPPGRRHGVRTRPPPQPPAGQAVAPAGQPARAAQPPAGGPSAPVATTPAAGSPPSLQQSGAPPHRGRRQGARTAPPPGSPPAQVAPAATARPGPVPPPAGMRRAPPPPVAAKPPPPAAMRRAPPPPVAAKPPPPSRPAAAAKPPPVPPQAAAGPPAGRRGGPPGAASGPKRAGKKCPVVNGAEVCR